MKNVKISILIAALMIFAAALVVAAENRGGEKLTIDASKGAVTFPHKEHQDNLKDCKLCHATFPQELGVIKKMKEKKELERKQVMDGVCLKCHKDYKAAGKDHGPINCNGCHGNGK